MPQTLEDFFPEVECPLRPAGPACVVQEMKVKEKTDSGVYLPEMARDRDSFLMQRGRVVAIGDMAFKDQVTHRALGEPPFKVGDYVFMPSQANYRMTKDGVSFRLIDFREVLAVFDDPQDLLAA